MKTNNTNLLKVMVMALGLLVGSASAAATHPSYEPSYVDQAAHALAELWQDVKGIMGGEKTPGDAQVAHGYIEQFRQQYPNASVRDIVEFVKEQSQSVAPGAAAAVQGYGQQAVNALAELWQDVKGIMGGEKTPGDAQVAHGYIEQFRQKYPNANVSDVVEFVKEQSQNVAPGAAAAVQGYGQQAANALAELWQDVKGIMGGEQTPGDAQVAHGYIEQFRQQNPGVNVDDVAGYVGRRVTDTHQLGEAVKSFIADAKNPDVNDIVHALAYVINFKQNNPGVDVNDDVGYIYRYGIAPLFGQNNNPLQAFFEAIRGSIDSDTLNKISALIIQYRDSLLQYKY